MDGGATIIGAMIAAGASMVAASDAADEAAAARKQQQEQLDQQRKNAAWVKENSKPTLSNATVAGTKSLEGIDPSLRKALDNGMDNNIKQLDGLDVADVGPVGGKPAGSANPSTAAPNAMPYGLNSTQNNPSIPSANGSPSNAPVGLLASAMPQQQPTAAPAAMMPSSLDAAVSSGSVPYASVHPESVSMNSPLFTPEQAKALSSAILSMGKGAQASAAAQSKAEQQRIAMIQRQMAEEELAHRRNFQGSLQGTRIMGANVG